MAIFHSIQRATVVGFIDAVFNVIAPILPTVRTADGTAGREADQADGKEAD